MGFLPCYKYYGYTLISWNDDCNELKFPRRKKAVYYNTEVIKNVTLARKYLSLTPV